MKHLAVSVARDVKIRTDQLSAPRIGGSCLFCEHLIKLAVGSKLFEAEGMLCIDCVHLQIIFVCPLQ